MGNQVHHFMSEKNQLFENFQRNGPSFEVLATYNNEITVDTCFLLDHGA